MVVATSHCVRARVEPDADVFMSGLSIHAAWSSDHDWADHRPDKLFYVVNYAHAIAPGLACAGYALNQFVRNQQRLAACAPGSTALMICNRLSGMVSERVGVFRRGGRRRLMATGPVAPTACCIWVFAGHLGLSGHWFAGLAFLGTIGRRSTPMAANLMSAMVAEICLKGAGANMACC